MREKSRLTSDWSGGTFYASLSYSGVAVSTSVTSILTSQSARNYDHGYPMIPTSSSSCSDNITILKTCNYGSYPRNPIAHLNSVANAPNTFLTSIWRQNWDPSSRGCTGTRTSSSLHMETAPHLNGVQMTLLLASTLHRHDLPCNTIDKSRWFWWNMLGSRYFRKWSRFLDQLFLWFMPLNDQPYEHSRIFDLIFKRFTGVRSVTTRHISGCVPTQLRPSPHLRILICI